MEEYYKSSDQLTCKLTRILGNLLVKPNLEPLLGVYRGGAMGGLDPPSRASPRLHSPKGGVPMGPGAGANRAVEMQSWFPRVGV